MAQTLHVSWLAGDGQGVSSELSDLANVGTIKNKSHLFKYPFLQRSSEPGIRNCKKASKTSHFRSRGKRSTNKPSFLSVTSFAFTSSRQLCACAHAHMCLYRHVHWHIGVYFKKQCDQSTEDSRELFGLPSMVRSAGVKAWALKFQDRANAFAETQG